MSGYSFWFLKREKWKQFSPKSQGYAHGEIARLLRITEPTLLSSFRDYRAGGVAKLKELSFYQPQSGMALR